MNQTSEDGCLFALGCFLTAIIYELLQRGREEMPFFILNVKGSRGARRPLVKLHCSKYVCKKKFAFYFIRKGKK